jgi:hypothetical protein
MLRVNGIHFPVIAATQQVLKNGPAYSAGTTGRADDGHRAWSEHCVQAVFLWGCLFLFIRRSQ